MVPFHFEPSLCCVEGGLNGEGIREEARLETRNLASG